MANKNKQEFVQKVLDLRRVTRVVAGGRRFRFRATVVIGDGKGWVGVASAKGTDVTLAVEKAINLAQKNLIKVPILGGTIPYEVFGKFKNAKVILKPAVRGKGIIAGSAVRAVCSLAGIENITAKILSSSTNKMNNAKAAIEALKKLKSFKQKSKK